MSSTAGCAALKQVDISPGYFFSHLRQYPALTQPVWQISTKHVLLIALIFKSRFPVCKKTQNYTYETVRIELYRIMTILQVSPSGFASFIYILDSHFLAKTKIGSLSVSSIRSCLLRTFVFMY